MVLKPEIETEPKAIIESEAKTKMQQENKKALTEEPSELLERDILADYFTLSGLRTQIGCKRENLELLPPNELIANGLDASKHEIPTVKGIFQRDSSGHVNQTIEDCGEGMDESTVRKTFTDYTKFYSSKYGKRLPTRGLLGHGAKVVTALNYDLAKEADASVPKIQIWSRNLKYSILPGFNEETQKPNILIENPQPCDFPVGTKISISLCLPESDVTERLPKYHKMIWEYAVFNPEANLYFIFSDGKVHQELDYPAICNVRKTFSGGPSAFWYSLDDFQEYVKAKGRSLKANGKDISIQQFILDEKFRGLTSDEKAGDIESELETKYQINRFSDIIRRKDLSRELFEKLRSFSTNPSADVLGEIGKEAMRKRITEIYGPLRYFKHKTVKGRRRLEGDVFSPYVLEIAVGVLSNPFGRQLLTGVNRAAFIENPFEGWSCTVEEGKSPIAVTEGTLQKYEITEDQNVIVVIHLISPNVEYENKGKGKVDINPFATDLAVTLNQLCKFYPAYKIRGLRVGRQSRATLYLKQELLRRKALLDKLGEMPLSEKTTQQSLYYKVRNKMEGRIDIKRKSFIQAISNLCAEIGGEPSYRDKLGITAAERAQLYFRGDVYPINLENIEELAAKGCDVILIEKEGVCEVLVIFADRKGVALVNSRGFASDYAKQLLEIARNSKGHIWLLTDLDDSGLVMYHSTLEGKIPRLGVNPKMLDELKIKREEVEEKYKPSEKHFKSLPCEYQELVKHTRVEIDAVLAAAGPEQFWNYVQQQIETLAPVRDINRSIDLTIKLPNEATEPINTITEFIQSVASEKQQEIMQTLREWKGGLLDVEEKEEEFQSQMCDEMLKNTQVQELIKQLKALADKIPKNTKNST